MRVHGKLYPVPGFGTLRPQKPEIWSTPFSLRASGPSSKRKESSTSLTRSTPWGAFASTCSSSETPSVQ